MHHSDKVGYAGSSPAIRNMNKKEIIEIVLERINNAPDDADFGIVDDIESNDTILYVFW